MLQQRIMLSFMKQHNDIARGFVKGNKVAQDELWNQLKDELNLAGSPTKETSCWKKTWLDWKNNVKRKIADNQTEVMETGRCNLNRCILSETDEEIALICGFYTTEGSFENPKNFCLKKENNSQQMFTPPSYACSSTASPPRTTSPPATSSPPRTSYSSSSSSSSGSPQPTTSQKRKRKNSNQNGIPSKKNVPNLEDLLTEEIYSLENISSKIEKLAKRKTMENLERKYDKIIELKQKKLDELCRHNVATEKHYSVMEQHAAAMLEVKLQEVALMEQKLDTVRGSNSLEEIIPNK